MSKIKIHTLLLLFCCLSISLVAQKEEKPIEVKQDWASYFCLVESKQASIRLDLALRNIAPIDGFKYRTSFSVMLLNPSESGFATQEELPDIYQIEDDVVAALTQKGAIEAGSFSSDGLFDLYFYSKTVDGYKDAIESVMKTHSQYKYVTEWKEDAEWKDYTGFLYPSEYEFQSIQNQRVLINLEKSGDNNEKERQVDHWIYFETEKDSQNYVSKVEALGYKVLSLENLNNDKAFPIQLNIARLNDTIWSNVNKYVWELVTLAKENNGYYDGWGCTIEK